MDSMGKILVTRTACFVAGELSIGLICSWATAFVFHAVDKKFQDAPSIAFRFELIGLAALIVLGWALFTGALVILGNARGWPTAANPVKTFLWGAAFPVALGIARWVHIPGFFQFFLFLFPIAAGFALTRRSTRTQPLRSARLP